MILTFIIRVILLSFIILGIAHLLPGIEVPHFLEALLFAFIVAIMNAFIAPILIAISFPLTVMTVGLFALFINIFTFWVAGFISYGVHLSSFWGVVWGGLIVWFASLCMNRWLVRYS